MKDIYKQLGGGVNCMVSIGDEILSILKFGGMIKIH